MTTYLVMRIVHIVLGAIWVGTIVFVSTFLLPSVQEAGPDGAKVMAGLQRRKYLNVLPLVALVTVLSGLWLYWRFTAGFDPSVIHTPSGMSFGLGGALGIVAFFIGVHVMRSSVIRAGTLAAQAAGLAEGADRTTLMGQAQALRMKAAKAGRVVAVLLVITTMLMAIGHYV